MDPRPVEPVPSPTRGKVRQFFYDLVQIYMSMMGISRPDELKQPGSTQGNQSQQSGSGRL